jgi:hypothetical protein
MQKLLLPCSIRALAMAIALHAMTPAQADDGPTATAREASCKSIGINAERREKGINVMIAEGRTQLLFSDSVLCGW